MTAAEQMQAMSDRIIREALETLRQEADDREIGRRCIWWCDEAAEARALALLAFGLRKGER